MARIKAPQKADSRRLFLMVRAFFIAVPLTIVSAVFLAVTDYPVEEWPFVAGVFAASLLLSTTLVSWLLIFLGEKLNQYGRQVLAERGVDLDAAIAAHPVPKPPWVVLTVTLILLLIGTTWGLALNILVTILDHMGMPLFGPGLPFVAKIMFVVGSSGLAVGFLLLFSLLYSIRRMERHRMFLSAFARFVFSVARPVHRSASYLASSGISCSLWN